MAEHEWRDPALTGVGDDARFGDPRSNPIAFLPVDGDALPSARSVLRAAPAQPWDLGGTYLMPAVAGRIEYAEHYDWVNHAVSPDSGLAERIDGWCEDRPVDELTDLDGVD